MQQAELTVPFQPMGRHGKGRVVVKWEVEFPIHGGDGARGIQLFVYDTDFSSDARDQALVDVERQDAIRHRRGADCDITRFTLRRWSGT
ncbi:hypothetical protein [Streptomyces sp. NPDC007355]|uniref:hypothetical protein n=1 Tax=Streptomyces sp. NPDC007355 TaxID=3364778 RepID=UPI0036AFD035